MMPMTCKSARLIPRATPAASGCSVRSSHRHHQTSHRQVPRQSFSPVAGDATSSAPPKRAHRRTRHFNPRRRTARCRDDDGNRINVGSTELPRDRQRRRHLDGGGGRQCSRRQHLRHGNRGLHRHGRKRQHPGNRHPPLHRRHRHPRRPQPHTRKRHRHPRRWHHQRRHGRRQPASNPAPPGNARPAAAPPGIPAPAPASISPPAPTTSTTCKSARPTKTGNTSDEPARPRHHRHPPVSHCRRVGDHRHTAGDDVVNAAEAAADLPVTVT